MENIKDKEFSTRDLYLASVLVTLKFNLNRIDFSIEGDKNLPIGYFCFENSERLQGARIKYATGQLAIEPRAFIQNMHALKSEVSNFQRNPHYEEGNINKEKKALG